MWRSGCLYGCNRFNLDVLRVMTQEDKQLLLKDLCARLPYGVNVQPSSSDAFPHKFKGYDKGLVRIDTDQRYELEHIKPYLRPMSSMTKEEIEELSCYENSIQRVDFYYSHHSFALP